jgi:hypothetical protein
MAVISLTSSGSSILFDDLTLEKVKDGPVVKPGVVVDDFFSDHIDENNWTESTAGRGGFLPTVSHGALIFDNRPMATLVSLSNFNGLISGDGDRRYRLRLHVSEGDDKRQDGFLECGISTDTVSLTTENSGLYFAHSFSVPGDRKDRIQFVRPSAAIRMYWHQDSKFVGGSNFDVKPNDAIKEVWYTFYFDPKNVTMYADGNGYDETAEARVGAYEHKMTNIASKGPVFLKLSGSNVKVNEISLMRPVPAVADPDATGPIPDPLMR